jgi:hypothetical protein
MHDPPNKDEDIKSYEILLLKQIVTVLGIKE